MERRKLFSDQKLVRRKLFSVDDCPKGNSEERMKSVICMDCGYKMDTTSGTTSLVCPKCGGTRFNVELYVFSPDNVPEPIPEKTENDDSRRKLFSSYAEEEEKFQKEFSTPSNELELKLKNFSGQAISEDKFQKEFSNLTTLDDLVEKNFAEVCDSGYVKISDSAYIMSKLFSKITISITKELDLDPSITCPECDKKEVIDKLENINDISPKSLIIIKKVHGIPTENHDEEWAKDSGILNDLGIEFGGTSRELPEFKKIIDDRYPDAPDNIMDLLKNKGIIRINGHVVEITK